MRVDNASGPPGRTHEGVAHRQATEETVGGRWAI